MPDDRGVPPTVATFAPPRLSLQVHGSDTTWVVRSLVLEESVHETYRLEVLALPTNPDFEFGLLLGLRVTLAIERPGRTRVLHGEVVGAELLDDRGPRVRFEVGPALSRLGLHRRSRIFQGLSAVEIATRLAGPGLDASRLTQPSPSRDYCVQYRETDLDFMLRILAEDGITMVWTHGEDEEIAVLVDRNQALRPASLPGDGFTASRPPMLPVSPTREGAVDRECITTLCQRARRRPERWSHSRWGWMSDPPVLLRTDHALVEHGAFGDQVVCDERRSSEDTEASQRLIRDDTQRRVRLRAAGDRARACTLTATTNAIALAAGTVFEADWTPHDGFREAWVVTRVVHEADVPNASVVGTDTTANTHYVNEIECQPRTQPLVPPVPKRPRAHGLHSARVTGPPGESIHCDRFGRIRVRMLWDDEAHDDEGTSCWLRVVQPWAGAGWGTSFIPRVGSEVLVSFVDGDPDRPVCAGSVYNGANQPAYPLPEHKARTGLRTATLGGDGDYSELSFDDTQGSEDAYLRAARRFRQHVGGAHQIHVGGSQNETVRGARTTDVSEDTLHVAGDRRETVDGHLEQTVRGAVRLRVSDTPPDTNGPKGLGVVVEHGTADYEVADGFVVKCGDSRFEIRPDAIVLSSPMIQLTSPEGSMRHPTSVTLTSTRLELAADTIDRQAIAAITRVDDGVSLHAGAKGNHAELELRSGTAMVHAAAGVDLQAEDIKVHGTRALALVGTACTVSGDAVTTLAEQQIHIKTPGDIAIVGSKIALN